MLWRPEIARGHGAAQRSLGIRDDDDGGGDDDDDDDDDDEVPDSSRSYKGHSARTRSRSLSPMRTRDHNIY